VLRNRVNRVLLAIGLGAAVCAFPMVLAAARGSGGPRAPGVVAVVVAQSGAADGVSGAQARSAPQILFPIPSQGPPRQFPLPGPTPKPPPPPKPSPPARPAPPPHRLTPVLVVFLVGIVPVSLARARR
jgi:hypothetical protein